MPWRHTEGADELRESEIGAGARDVAEAVYRTESRRVLATLIRLVGDFDLAEDALHDAFTAAVEQWPRHGVPANPRAWLVSTGRFKAIDRIRRRARFDASETEISTRIEEALASPPADHRVDDDAHFEDDRLRLIFTCCHPALPRDARVALTLREVCGLTTAQVASGFLTTPATIAQRIVRAKRRIRAERIPYEVPARTELAARLDAVLQVIYLIFNEGYSASSGETLTQPDLSGEAIHLGRLLAELMPQPEVLGLLGLMLLNESRRAARTSPDGDIILLDEQDRSLWDRRLVDEGTTLVRRALAGGPAGVLTLQAAIAALHANAAEFASTDWAGIVALYDQLLQIDASPVVELNRAASIAMRDGPAAGLALIDDILQRGDLRDYAPAHAARGELHRRLAHHAAARDAFLRALALTSQEPQRRLLLRRIEALPREPDPGESA